MSKTTKIIAALGVVAGLGVAALPAFTFADGPSVQGDVELYVEVSPAIAMTITGNNDENATAHYDYTKVATPVAGELSTYYETTDGRAFTLTQDQQIVEGKAYFTRSEGTTGVDVFAPYSAGQGNVGGHAEAFKIGPSSSSLELLPNTTGTMTSTVTVYTNNASGYTLTLKDSDETTNLTNGSYNIPTGSGAVAAGTAKWNVSGGLLTNAAMVASNAAEPLTVKTTAQKTSGGDATIMTYNVATDADQATGTYTDTITYTATCNNS